MTHQKALILPSRQGAFVVGTIVVPKPASGEILIKIYATALNPIDWKIQAYGIVVDTYPAVLGSDIAGIVEEVGQDVVDFEVGDRVLTQGVINVNRHASFQQYTIGFADVSARIPDELSFEEAATIPLGLATAAIGLFNRRIVTGSVGLYPPWEDGGRGRYEGKPFFVFGGSSSVGQYVIQLAKLAGFAPLITTASLRNAEYLQDLGATHVIDRNLSAGAIRAKVETITTLPIETIYDAVSTADTQNLAYDLLASGGCLVLVLQDVIDKKRKRGDKRIVQVSGSTNIPANRELGISLYSRLTDMLQNEDIQANRVGVLRDGLRGIMGGLQRLRMGVSNLKLVARPQETA